MITASVSELPESVIVEWMKSGRTPENWRIYYSKGSTLFTWQNTLIGSIIFCYPFVVAIALYNLASLSGRNISSAQPFLINLGWGLAFVVTFIGGIVSLVASGIMASNVQTRREAAFAESNAHTFSETRHSHVFFLWFMLTYTLGTIVFLYALLHSVVDPATILEWLASFALTPPFFMGMTIFARALVLRKPFLLMTGVGFVETQIALTRYEYAIISSMSLTKKEDGILITYITGGTHEWHPWQKYDISLDEIIQDYERYKARKALISILTALTQRQ